MGRVLVALLALLLLPSSALAGQSKAGVAVLDATWHVGASAGQFSDDTGPFGAEGVDPHMHSTKKRISDGVGLRTSTRALVVQGSDGDRLAIVAHDLYLPQDLLLRRVAGILAVHDQRVGLGLAKGPKTHITGKNLAMTASHNHNTPYYSTPGWGTAIFQDVIDLRFYEYMAQRMAKAVINATREMRPVRMGGATRTFDAIQSHTYGPKVGDDGTPAGQPYSHTTRQLSVVVFDDVSNPRKPKPYANWVVFGVHPEWTWGYDLINGDITHAAARMVDRDLGTRSVFSQRETGSSGPHSGSRVHDPAMRREFQDNGFGQLDRGARLLADAIKKTADEVRRGKPERRSAFAAMDSTFEVGATSMRFAPPSTRPYPGVSNCNTASFFHGDPRVPILGLPDCKGVNDGKTPGAGPVPEIPFSLKPVTDLYKPLTSPMYEQLKAAGVPVPESYSATALTAVEETAAVHLMALRLGGIGVTICPCEQFTDTALNIESRLDKVEGNIWKGFDWNDVKTPAGRDWCVPGEASGTWTCANPQNPSADLAPISDLLYRRFRAQINNDAKGWETDLATLGSEAEPADPSKIKGNFTHEEMPRHGFDLVLAVGMGNDYWGYMPEYREYRSHDHYRKALAALGPHGADFLATRLSRMAASLNGGAKVEPSPQDLAMTAEQGRAEALAQGLGALGTAYTKAYEPTLPQDGGAPRIVKQPKDITRFDATTIEFVGGSNYTDLPSVSVQRRGKKGRWERYGDMTGDVQLMVDFPKPEEVTAWRTGAFEWKWTANFEAFSSDIAQHDAQGDKRESTPAGEYRFVLKGRHRGAGGVRAYKLRSRTFEVAPWGGVTVSDLRVEPDGRVSFAAPPVDYPDWASEPSPFRFIERKWEERAGGQRYCSRCTFRPWADKGALASAYVTAGKKRAQALPAADGRWRTVRAPGEGAYIAPGDLQTEHGETNAGAIK
jgi:hypothetical protein